MNADSGTLPRVVLFAINGAGLGHLSRTLAYARRLRGRAIPVFFSLASAMEVIHRMGFEGDYFVSEAWTRSDGVAWNRELMVRFGLLLDEVRPQMALFDGTRPFPGFLDACDAYGVPYRVWSNRRLYRPGHDIAIPERELFDLIIEPGELGSEREVTRPAKPGRTVVTPPVTLLGDTDLLERAAARAALGLDPEGRYALLSLGAGYLDDVRDVALGLIGQLGRRGFDVYYSRAPIAVRDVPLPADAHPLEVYPLVRYMRAFDVFVGAAGYNTCCEVVQSGVPSLLVPNRVAADDQARRAEIAARHGRVIVSRCDTDEERGDAVDRLLALADDLRSAPPRIALDGADVAADEMLALVGARAPA